MSARRDGSSGKTSDYSALRRLPVEVVALARWLVTPELRALGLVPTLRIDESDGEPFLTENGNVVFDCALPEPMCEAGVTRELARALLAIGGVVNTGLFLPTAEPVLDGHPDAHPDDHLDTPPEAGDRLP
jgi:ribose 5-phosphate isomerase A